MTAKPENQVQTAFRLPESLLKRLDKLADSMSKPGRRVTRAEVLRLAAFLGVEQFEAEQKKVKEERR